MGQGRALPSAHFSLSTHSSVHPCCHSEMTEWLGPSNKHIYIPVGCGVQIMLEMGECRQKRISALGTAPKLSLCRSLSAITWRFSLPLVLTRKELTSLPGVFYFGSAPETGERLQFCHTALRADVSRWHLSVAVGLARGCCFLLCLCALQLTHWAYLKLLLPGQQKSALPSTEKCDINNDESPENKCL